MGIFTALQTLEKNKVVHLNEPFPNKIKREEI